jgi:hypothetical protein
VKQVAVCKKNPFSDEHRFTDASQEFISIEDDECYIVQTYRSYDSEENGYATIKPTRTLHVHAAVKSPYLLPCHSRMRDEDVERVIMKSSV